MEKPLEKHQEESQESTFENSMEESQENTLESKQEKSLEKNLKILIKIKCHTLSFQILQNIVDHAIIIHKNKINMMRFYENNKFYSNVTITSLRSFYVYEYYKSNKIELPEINVSDIVLNNKKQNILDIFYRVTNNNFKLLYLVMRMSNFNVAKNIVKKIKHCNDDDTKGQGDVINTTEQGNCHNDNDEDDVKGNEFIDVGEYFLDSMRPTIKTKHHGYQSTINFFEICDKTNKLISKEINMDIDNIIVKKKFIDIKHALTDKLGGCKGTMEREVSSLLKIYKKPHFPTLLSINKKELDLYLTYCGVPLDNSNVPQNWKEQLLEIIKLLKESNVSSNDMWQNNFLIHNNIIFLVDFGWSSNEHYYPYINITNNDINNSQSIFELLDHVFERVVQDRIIFEHKQLQ